MSRPKGSKNKIKGNLQKEFSTEENTLAPNSNCPIVKRGRGRPKKVTTEYNLVIPKEAKSTLIALFGNIKDLKREIRRLRKIKLACRAGSKERIELHRKIKELKHQLKNWQDQKDTQVEQKIEIKIKDKSIHTSLLTEEEAKEKHSNDNGCMFFNICKKEKDIKGINVTCFNPKYYIEKIDRKCTQLDSNCP
jgi:phosphate starvation-inducible protein PhoH